MNTNLITFMFLLFSTGTSFGQDVQTYSNTNSQLTKAYALPNNKLNWTHTEPVERHSPGVPEFNGSSVYDTATPKVTNNCIEDCGYLKSGIDVQVGREFETNHLFGGRPSDNEIAISNSGKIVSVDNSSISYFKETGDSIVQFGLPWEDFYGVSVFGGFSIFDPKVIYDNYSDRFILVTVLHDAFYEDSRILLSFSQNNVVDSISWNHYQIHCDSVYTSPSEIDYWFDYPNIAVNKNEFFLSLNVFDYATSISAEPIVFQIQKNDGYVGSSSLIIKEWKNVQDAAGQQAYSIVPLCEASQIASYEDTMYFVSNYSGTSATYHWFTLFGDVNSTTSSIDSYTTSTSQTYTVPSFASQMGGNGTDRIKFIDARIQSGYYQNGKLHFVHHRSDAGWSEILYGRITMSGNSFTHNTWGGSGTNLNYMYPSIAHFGLLPDEENAMITFARTGPTIFNEICVVNYENGWSPQTTVVKSGVGLLDLVDDIVAPWDTLERIGDYTDIQRRYNSQTCWLIGSFPTGLTPNHFNVIKGTNSYVAEVGRDGVHLAELKPKNKLKIYPNPSYSGIIHIQVNNQIIYRSDISITDAMGRSIHFGLVKQSDEVILTLPDNASGIIIVNLTLNNGNHEVSKIIVQP